MARTGTDQRAIRSGVRFSNRPRAAVREIKKPHLQRACLRKPIIQTAGCNDPTARNLSPWWQKLGWNRGAARKQTVADVKSDGIPQRSG